MRLGVWFLLFTAALTSQGVEKVQSRFVGPNSLKVWQHWQNSWNVDSSEAKYQYELVRLTDGKSSTISFEHSQLKGEGLKGFLRCESWVRKGDWDGEVKLGQERMVKADGAGYKISFRWPDAVECVDRSEKNLTRRLELRIEDAAGKKLFSESFVPMHVRGKNASYWNNRIPPYNAHAGKGEINVATQLQTDKEWDKWDGIQVSPVLNFVDRNTLKADAFIGLHRHEANQEVYLVESGEAEMAMGVAYPVGEPYTVERLFWEESGTKQNVQEFKAERGYTEFRVMSAGDLSVIVPDKTKNRVYFHGLKAISPELVFWTMGTKN